MHIPDGYLSPQTYVPAYGAMVPIWAVASRVLKKTLRTRQVPTLALGAAFCFVIMMFNIPVFGGTSGHAAGAVLVAVLLGPWAAVMAVSLALIVQALIFGDGGITAIGANCLNMAVVMPFVGWGVYRLIAGKAPAGSRRHSIGAAVGGYVGLNAAALATAVMFGIQPMIARGADGHALYCPFGLNVAIPAMLIPHLLLVGFVEAIITGLVVNYIQLTEPSMIPARSPSRAVRKRLPTPARLAIGLGLLVLISPLGLYLPARFAAGSAWGEWSAAEIEKMVGYTPAQMERLDGKWRAPIPDYELHGRSPTLVYILSGMVGVGVVAIGVLSMRKVLSRKEPDELAPGVDATPKRR